MIKNSVVVVQIKGETKRIDKARFEPRAQRCIRVDQEGKVRAVCPLAKIAKDTNIKESPESTFECPLFSWDIKVALGRKQAVCSRKTIASPFSVHKSQEETNQERIANGWEINVTN